MSETLILNGKDLTLEDLYSVVYDRRPVQIDPEVIPLVDKSRQVLFDMAADGKPVYGLNHGVGWNKDREFSQDFFEQYNRNLINSHSLGVAPFASVEEVRAMMCIRLNTALCGRTGIASNILKMYEEFLNRGIHPRAMRRGAVGEGDVSTMSMIGQAMIGQGEVEYHGEIIPAIDAMRAEGIEPAILGPKDGLSIVSSNAQGESMVVLLVKEVEELIKLSDAIYCLHLEGLNGGLQPLGERVNEVRGLPGQIHCAAECRRFLEGSYLEHPDSKRALQDPLSFRCGAAINGSVYDSLEYVKKILELQINRTDDNPCILYEEGTTSVSPNFEVTTLSLGVDMLAAALCHMSHAITNRLYKIVDPGFTVLICQLQRLAHLLQGFQTIFFHIYKVAVLEPVEFSFPIITGQNFHQLFPRHILRRHCQLQQVAAHGNSNGYAGRRQNPHFFQRIGNIHLTDCRKLHDSFCQETIKQFVVLINNHFFFQIIISIAIGA